MPHLMNMSRDPLLARILTACRRVLQKGISDLGLRDRDAGVFEEEVREEYDARCGVDEQDEERDEEEDEAGASLHCGYWGEGEVVVVIGRSSWISDGAGVIVRRGLGYVRIPM